MSAETMRVVNVLANLAQLGVTVAVAVLVILLLRRYSLHHRIRSDIAEARGLVNVLSSTPGGFEQQDVLVRAAQAALDRGLSRIDDEGRDLFRARGSLPRRSPHARGR